MGRPEWDEYFMKITNDVAERSTCIRRKVGAILVKDKRILSTGYNGAPSNLEHCEVKGCLRQQMNIPSGERAEICRGIHAEQNAIIQASVHGFTIKGATLFSTTQPCLICTKMIINAGIVRVVYEGSYPDELSLDMLQEAGIELLKRGSD